MDPNPSKPGWLESLNRGSHACFFYTAEEEFFEISVPYLKKGLDETKERILWVLPPTLSFSKAKEDLMRQWNGRVEAYLKRRQLFLIAWERWYGTEQSTQDLVKRTQRLLQETLQEGFSGLRILTHSPHRTSSYWKDFFLYEEALPKRLKSQPFVSLSAYSLIDCPAHAISSIALNHSLCLIHRGAEWEWLTNKSSNQLHSSHLYNRHTA